MRPWQHAPVRIASGDSSRASRRVTRVPWASLRASICSWETSRVIGIGKSEPSARRSVSTQLEEGGKPVSAHSFLATTSEELHEGAPLVVLLAHEALERREPAVHDEFEVAELTFSEANVGNLLRLLQELGTDGRIAGVQVLENSSVGCVESLQARKGV